MSAKTGPNLKRRRLLAGGAALAHGREPADYYA